MTFYAAPFAHGSRGTGAYYAPGGWWIKKIGSGWVLTQRISGETGDGGWIYYGKHKTLTAAVVAYKTQTEAS
jgi:hypothetical protein